MAFTNEEIIGSIIPRVYVSRIILQSTDQDKLLTNIQFVLKERFGNDNISSWLEQDPEFLKYFSLRVVESSDPRYTAELERLIEIFGINGDPSIFEEIDLISNTKVFRPFVAGETLQTMLEKDKAEKVESDPGISEYNIYFDVDFNSGLSENVEHLSYFFFTFYDLTSALNDAEQILPSVRPGDTLQALGVTEVHLEKVISNSEIIDISYVYTDEEQNIWPGPIHTITRQENGTTVKVYRSGQTEDTPSIDLQRVEIQNNKIQDYRQLDRILDFQRTDVPAIDQESIASFRDVDINKLTFDIDSSISDLFASIDQNKAVGLTFSLDFKQLFLKNSVYGKMLSYIIKSNTETRESRQTNDTTTVFNEKAQHAKKLLEVLYLMAEIESITVKRKRIDIDDSLFSKKELEQEVFAAQGAERIAEIERPVLFTNNTNQKQIRTFSLPDNTGAKNGVFQYSVEIEYLDKTKVLIGQMIDLLKLEQRKFKMYYEYAILPDAFNQVTKRFRRNAFDELQRIAVDIETQIENFSREAVEERSRLLEAASSFIPLRPSSTRRPVVAITRQNILSDILNVPTSIITYLTVVDKFFEVDTQRISTTVASWLNPDNGTPETISYVLQIYDELIVALESIINLTKTVESSLNEKGENTPQESPRSSSKVVKIKKYFKNSPVDLDNSYLLEYLNHTKRDNANIATTDFSFGYEALKADLINKKMDNLSQLSKPSNNESLQEKTFNNLSEMLADFGNLTIHDNPYYIQNREMGLEVNVRVPSRIRQDLKTAYENAVISSRKELLARASTLEADDKLVLNKLLFNMLRPTLSLNTDNIKFAKSTYRTKNLFEMVNPRRASVGIESETIQNTDTLFRTVTNLIEGVTFRKNYVSNIPNQIKSLFQLKTNNPDIPVNDAESRLKYEMLKRIEYLDGFEFVPEEDTFIMNSPIWRALDGLDSLTRNSQNILFCRMIDHNDPVLSYKFNLPLKEQAINEYFFINNFNYHENYLIRSGATNISTTTFEQRCVRELQKYFENDAEPSVNFVVGTEEIGSGDSYLNTKYTFLAPYGIHFDNLYKVIGVYTLAYEFDLLLPVVSVTTTNSTQDTQQNIQTRFSGFTLFNQTNQNLPRVSQYSTLLETIYSKSK